MDGQVLGDDIADEYEVTMADGTHWAYVRSDLVKDDPGRGGFGRQRIYRSVGRR
ncbi:MAG: hypothetical protein JWM76_3860 [Pseudonocardiales bacterium]|nr:hypothetical protein [Pseudonocardiales bacterium]